MKRFGVFWWVLLVANLLLFFNLVGGFIPLAIITVLDIVAAVMLFKAWRNNKKQDDDETKNW